ncbi:ABC transporter ATP-binding protein [Hydrogenophaga crassostreae]|uniref:ABC transporter ATP-binding protein n=1 Tax=Hydrogenophaga crassostreae TaxID=1763535 RepID=A0A162W3F9_9BURK|nr:Fe-S cluster assembly ATPase SufC [Hydrogenophaga crassostreae]AOW14418.1 Fe-S cluster assembly ATPase SufC [Hydrogenophaga crassostreae]OAD43557.1 ABC transporter ATP-binding protein [Hydrogenophaga crassostreae]
MTSSQPLLQVQDLRVDIGGRHVLKSISLDVPAGSLVVLMGANGSGKSTLGLTLAGHPRYQVVGGQARFGGQDLLALNPEERARAGLFVSFQAPPDIPGVKNNLFIRTALNAVREARGEAPLDAFDFLGDARATASRLGLPEAMLSRPVNDGFSGGERKRNELLQLALLKPKLALLDEIDSGMDVDGTRAVVELVQSMRADGTAFVVVSHYLQLIESLQPDAVLRLDQGCIAETGDLALARDISRTGFARAAEPMEA